MKSVVLVLFLVYFTLKLSSGYKVTRDETKLKEVLFWKQISYEIDGVLYNRDANHKKTVNGLNFEDDLEDSEKYFIQYNNVPIGLEVWGDRIFVTVPRRRYGIPSTLNYVWNGPAKSPALQPYPGSQDLVSVYRPRIDECGRLWMVDTGLLEVPGDRRQVRKPSIVIFDLKTDKQILRYELNDSDLVNERTPGGLTSITVDVTKDSCDDAYAYINDLATEGMIVYSLKDNRSWRLNHPTFLHDEAALNFTVAGYVINWKDGLFSIALSQPDAHGDRTAYYHPMVSNQEFSINTKFLKSGDIGNNVKVVGTRGTKTQSGSHGYHAPTKTLFFANPAQDAMLCWRVDTKMAPENIGIAAQDHTKLVYIADLKIKGDEVWVLVNQMPKFVFSTLNTSEDNFYIHRFKLFNIFAVLLLVVRTNQQERRLGKFQEVFAWKQLTYNINGIQLLQDRFSEDIEEVRSKREADRLIFSDDGPNDNKPWNEPQEPENEKPVWQTTPPSPSTNPDDEAGRFFIQYNNVPMGVERVGDRLFITVPRRRYGIPSTLNYVSLSRDSRTRSPPLRPYPDLARARSLTSVYRTRADQCGRLWMVDTGLLEIPGNPQQVQAPAIVIFDLTSDRQILRYPFKSSDLPAANTPTGLASITVDITDSCDSAYAYVPDLTTYGLIVYSLQDNNSWRLTHNYFHFNPLAGNLRISGESFQWSDGIFSITLTEPGADGCRTAYFHPLASTQEFSVSTCVLQNSSISSLSDYYRLYSYVGNRGENSQSTMHGYHPKSHVVFYADVARDAVSCWNSGNMLNPANVAILARDSQRLSYPSDLHVTNDEVWVMSNTLPRFGYSTLDTNEYNFFIYRGNVNELIAGTVCASQYPVYR
ncbi:uncharacterized protein LOC123879729 [Maniola jurtina]|uniref:uncharacterized protein LOC123879729 n=1 Tax=Maniola jurtina TaxID=191418 RepID=UPI001E68819B|nr:uncharacterized protein LOC123879729 [Maniola jurtina]